MEDIIAKGWQMRTEEIRTIQENVWRARTNEGLFALKRSL